MVCMQHEWLGREGKVHRMCCTLFSYPVVDRLLSLQVVVECTEPVCHTQVLDIWHASVYIYTLKLQICTHDRSPRTVGSALVVCDMLNRPLPTKNVVTLL